MVIGSMANLSGCCSLGWSPVQDAETEYIQVWHSLHRKRISDFNRFQEDFDGKFHRSFCVQIRWTWASPFGCISQPFSINRSDPTVTAFKVSSFALQGRRPGERDLIRNMHTHTHTRERIDH